MKTIGRMVLVLCMVVICAGNAHSQSILIHSDIEVLDANNYVIGVLQQNGHNLKVYNEVLSMFINFDAYGNLMTPKVPIFFTEPTGCSTGLGAWVPLSMDWGLETQFNVYRFLSDQPVSFLPNQFVNTQPTLGSCAVPTLVSTNQASAPTYEERCLPAPDCPMPTATDTFIWLGIRPFQLPFNIPLVQPLHFYSLGIL
jgi:hypothetical protein